MTLKSRYFVKQSFIFSVFLFLGFTAFSQITPGLIVEPATGAGRIVLDPNLDGYTSLTTAGFSGLDDQTSAASEIVFKKMTLIREPNSDLGAGPNCNYTDFVRDTVNANMNSAGGNFLDANNNWIFRLRLGTYSPNTKSYSLLIDTDGKFGNSGPNADAQYSVDNPGFEIEILLSTNNGVYVYDVNSSGVPLSPVLKRSYTVTTNYQKSKALSQICGSNDFFLDFFVPFGDLTADFSITTSTPLRYAITDNMSANQSTLGHLSNISDIWGINGANNEGGLKTFIDNQTPTCASCTPTGLRSACPVITAPIQNGAASVSGTSTEADGTTITLYKNGVATAFTTTVSGGTWTISSISPALAANDLIGATATASGKGESIFNCNIVTVKSCSVVAPLTSGASITLKTVCGNAGVGTSTATIKLYLNNSLITPGYTNGVNVDGSFVWGCAAGTTGSNCTTVNPAAGGGCLTNGNSYEITQTVGGCESESVCLDPNAANGIRTTAPGITTTPITTATTSITGTCASGAVIFLYADGTQIGTVTGTTTWTIGSLTLTLGQVITAKARVSNQCLSVASASRTIINGTSTPPVITTTGCGTISTVEGTSSNAAGTVIQVYDNGSAVGSTTTVGADGKWSVSGLTITSGHAITAKATISGGSQSVASNSVTVATKTTNSVTINAGTYTNQTTSVSGTGTNGDIIRLYVDDAVLSTTATVSGGAWTIAVTAGLDLFKNAVIKATATTGSNCESNASSTVTVTAVAPSTINVTQTVTTCNGIASISVPTSQNGVLYQLYDNTTPFSNGVVGNGGTITLLSSFVNATKTGLTVKATNVIDETTTTMSGTVTINIAPADSTWRGTYSTDWFDYRNWCLNGAIPTSTIKAKILAGTPFAPIIAASGAVCNELILYSGSTLTASTNQNLDVYGAWINNGGTYTANSGSVTFRGTDTLSIRGTTSTTFGNVTMNLTGTAGNDFITLARVPMTVTGALTLTDGRVITTSTFILNLTSTASSTGGSTASFVDGPMTKAGTTAFTFPVGDGTLYAPIATGTPTSSTTFRAQYFETAYSNTTSMASSPTPVLGGVSLTEYWQLDRTVGTGNATVRLFWDNTNNGSSISSCPDLRVAYFNGTNWENPSDSSTTLGTGCPSPTGTGTVATDNNLTSFGTFTLGTKGVAPLPVKLIAFNGKCKEKDVVLKWTTASELNNDYFTLERGTNGTDVKPIATIKGSGTSNQLLNYQFIDTRAIGENKSEAVLFYRLKQTDFDGKFEYSNFITVKNCNDNPQEIVLYPNVSSGTVQLNNHEIVTSIEVYNSLGGLVYSSEISNPKAEIFLDLPIGMYYYFLKNEDELVGKGKLMIK